MPGVLVYVEQVDGEIAAVTRELLGKGKELAAALGGPLSAVVVGSGVGAVAEKVTAYGADTVYTVDDPRLSPTRPMGTWPRRRSPWPRRSRR